MTGPSMRPKEVKKSNTHFKAPKNIKLTHLLGKKSC